MKEFFVLGGGGGYPVKLRQLRQGIRQKNRDFSKKKIVKNISTSTLYIAENDREKYSVQCEKFAKEMRDMQEELSKMNSVAQEKTSMVERLQQQLSQEQQRTAQLESGKHHLP